MRPTRWDVQYVQMVCMDRNGQHVWGRDALSYNIDQEAKEHLISGDSLLLALCQHKEMLTFLHVIMTRPRRKPWDLSALFLSLSFEMD